MFVEQNRQADWLLKVEHNYSFDEATLKMGFVYKSGSVLKLAAGKYELAAAGDTAVAILLYQTDATLADTKAAIITRLAEVKGALLTYSGTLTEAQKTTKATQLAAVGIIVR